MTATLADIAQRANVTPATVSRILSRRKNFSVSEAKRLEVLRIAEALNYRPQRAARALVDGRTYTVSIVLGSLERDLTSPAFSVVLTEIIRALWAHGYATNVIPVNTDRDPDEAVLMSLRESHVDGYILPTVFLKPKTLEELYQNRTPVVSYRQSHQTKKGTGFISYVEVDELAAYREAIAELYELGHRRFCAFGFTRVLRVRLPVMRRAMALAAPDAVLDELSYPAQGTGPLHDREQGRAGARRYWERIVQSTAVLCSSDLVAMGLMDVMAEHQFKPGRELSVLGSDNIEENPSYQPFRGEPQVTTIDRQSAVVGQAIAQTMLKHLEQRDPTPRTHAISTRVVRRKTFGPPL